MKERTGQGRMVYLDSTPLERLFRLESNLPTYEDSVADRGLGTAAKILNYRTWLSTIYFLNYKANHEKEKREKNEVVQKSNDYHTSSPLRDLLRSPLTVYPFHLFSI